MKDEHAVVLDFLVHGKAGGKDEPLAQVIGTENFSLLEVVARDDAEVKTGDRVYIGDGDRDTIKYIKGKISGDDLTGNATSELEYVLEELVDENEDQFVEFFNESVPITTRRHSLELLPSVGKKHMRQIIDAREGDPFESYDDIQERVDLLPDPRTLITKRLRKEIDGDCKRYLFIEPPKKNQDKSRRGRR